MDAVGRKLSEISTNQVILGTLVVTGVFGFVWLLVRFRTVLLLLFLAIVISIALQPIVRWLEQRDVGPQLSITVIYILLLGAAIGVSIYGLPILISQSGVISRGIAEIYRDFRLGLLENQNPALWYIGSRMPLNLTAFMELTVQGAETEEDAALLLAQAWAYLNGAIFFIFAVIATLLLSFYWTLEGNRIQQAFFLLLPSRNRASFRQFTADVQERLGKYVLGQSILCVIIGAASFILYLVVGLPYALALALFAGIMEAIPNIGPVLGAIPALVVAFTVSPTAAVWVGLGSIVIQQLENSYLVPNIMGRALGIRPLVTLLALITFSALFGILGALIALPLMAIIQLTFDRYIFSSESMAEAVDGDRTRASLLRYETQQLVQDVRKQVRNKSEVASAQSDQVEDSLEAIALDLDSYLASLNNGAGP